MGRRDHYKKIKEELLLLMLLVFSGIVLPIVMKNIFAIFKRHLCCVFFKFLYKNWVNIVGEWYEMSRSNHVRQMKEWFIYPI